MIKRRIATWGDFKLFEQIYRDKEDNLQGTSAEAFKKMRLACFEIMGQYPFFRSLLSSLVIRENRNLRYRTMATDGVSIHYDPGYALGCTMEEVKFVICHEIMHNALYHFLRKQENPVIWNMAADYALNQLLIADKIGKMPEGGLTVGCGRHPKDKTFTNLSAEEIYGILMKDPPKDTPEDENPQSGPPPPPEEIFKPGTVIYDKANKQYGIIKSFDPNTKKIVSDPIKEEDVRKYLESK